MKLPERYERAGSRSLVKCAYSSLKSRGLTAWLWLFKNASQAEAAMKPSSRLGLARLTQGKGVRSHGWINIHWRAGVTSPVIIPHRCHMNCTSVSVELIEQGLFCQVFVAVRALTRVTPLVLPSVNPGSSLDVVLPFSCSFLPPFAPAITLVVRSKWLFPNPPLHLGFSSLSVWSWFMNPRGPRLRADAGTGTGWQIATPRKTRARCIFSFTFYLTLYLFCHTSHCDRFFYFLFQLTNDRWLFAYRLRIQ